MFSGLLIVLWFIQKIVIQIKSFQSETQLKYDTFRKDWLYVQH